MGTQQLATIIIAITVLCTAFFLGNTTYPKSTIIQEQQKAITINSLLTQAETALTPAQKNHATHLQQELTQASSDTAKLRVYNELLQFWGGELRNDEIAVWYVAEKAKLEKSEKNITFAANLILNNVIGNNTDVAKRGFKANVAKELYEQAILLNQNSDSLQIGLGTCYMYGAGGSNPMEGIAKVLGISKRDTTNAYAHKMLGYGNLQNGSTDKALDRFIKAYTYNTADSELVPYIALLSKKLGKNDTAQFWYNKTKELMQKNKELFQAFDKEYQASAINK